MTSVTTTELGWKQTVEHSPACESSALLVGFEPPLIDELTMVLEALAGVFSAPNDREALRLLESRDFDVLCIGPRIGSRQARELIVAAVAMGKAAGRTNGCFNLVLSTGDDAAVFQDFVDDGSIFYLSRRVPEARDVSELVRSALEHRRKPAADNGAIRQVVEICEQARYLGGESDPRRLGLATAQVVQETIGADRARVLYHDIPAESLLAWTVEDSEPTTESSAAGIVGFVARTSRSVRVDRVGDDPRYDPDADNQNGDRAERLLAMPVQLPILAEETNDVQSATRVTAVIVAIRPSSSEPFSDRDVELLRLLADRLAPAFDRLLVHADDPGVGDDPEGENIFRLEALHYLRQSENELGRPMDISPRWTRWAFPLIVLTGIAAFVYAFAGTISEYAGGFAVVRVQQGAAPDLVAFFPGRYRPQLRPGMPVRFRIDGYPSGDQILTIASVSDIVGPREARRLLGPVLGDAVPLAGPVVVVRSSLLSDRFTNGKETYAYRNGMPGNAEVTLRSDRILSALMPSLRFLFRTSQ